MESFAEAAEGLTSRRAASDRIETRRHSSSTPPTVSPRQRAKYEAAVSLLILEVYNLFDLPLPESAPPGPGLPSEMEQKVSFWTNALIRTVPEDELRPALDFTIDRHEEARLINPMDIKRGYKAMLAERERARVEEEAERRRAARELEPCRSCDSERVKGIWFPSSGASVTLPCQACRPQAFAVALEQWHERRAQEPPAGSVALVKQAAGMLDSEAEQ
ncbi:MAG: hypothetical protein M3416_01505 [Acidobacteriota bacterium]|nr:hypothetical protein [Acidobacteriota bacterium]